jgi:hypothetical protein
MIGRRFRLVVVGVLAVGGTLLPSTMTAAQADTAPFTPWSSYLSGWTDEYIPTSANDCVSGRPNCLKGTLRELADIFETNAKSCSHNAPFSLAYLRMTQTYGWSRDIPGYYEDVAFANHQDAVFAKYYIDAFRNWKAGNRAAVPQSWLVAFDAATGKKLSGSGDLLLGMNAHINRDLPYVLASVGLVAPDGSSRKPDFDKVEVWLNSASEPLNAESATRFDPAMDDASDPLSVGYWGVFQMVSGWRENAWRNAEALVMAQTPAERALVEARIESNANLVAQTIQLSTSYVWPLQTSAPRDSFCSLNKNKAAPMDYDFGPAAPYGWEY